MDWLECDVCCQVVEAVPSFRCPDGPSTIVCIECMRKSMEMVEWHLKMQVEVDDA